MADIVIDEFMDDAIAAELAEDYDVLYDPTLVERPDDLKAAIKDCRALIVRNRTWVNDALLDAAPGLRVLGRLGVGMERIDQAACAARGIPVFPATGTNAQSVAEYAVAAILMLLRGAYHSNAQVIAGTWPRTQLMGREAADKRLGIIGLGDIGANVAWRARGLGMEVVATDPYVPADDARWSEVEKLELPELLATADVVTLHTPLTDETRHIIDSQAIARMKPGAMIINTARGGVIDEDALIPALKDGRLGGAALDVFEDEPIDAAGGAKFAEVPNLILTPHIAGVTHEANRRTSEMTIASVRRVLEGDG